METYEEQIFPGFEEESQFCPRAYPASQVPWPGSEEARATTGGSGRQCSMLFETSSRLGLFSKILLGSSHWTNSMEYCYVWGRLDTKFALSAFQLTPLGLSTEECGSSLWPTASAGNFNDGESLESWEARRARNKAKGINGNGQGTPLAIAAKLWPTPNAVDFKGANPLERRDPCDDDLPTRAQRLWPTPTVIDGGSGGRNMEYIMEKGTNSNLRNAAKLWSPPPGEGLEAGDCDGKATQLQMQANLQTTGAGTPGGEAGMNLATTGADGGKAQIDLREFAVRMLPTPTAQDGANNAGPSQMERNSLSLNATFGGSLNPRFVEELMGFPIDHTALKPSATRSSRSKPTRSLRRSPKSN